MRISLRKAQAKDCRQLWLWRNNADVRRNSFSSRPVSYKRHQAWFQSKQADPRTSIYVGMCSGAAFGMIRLEFNPKNTAAVHLCVKSSARGRGLGAVLLKAGCQAAERRGVRRIEALVLEANGASLRVFEKNFFKPSKRLTHNGKRTVLLIRRVLNK